MAVTIRTGVTFEPSFPKYSIKFNPLDAIPRDPIKAYQEIGRLVPLLMVPTDAKSAKSFWEGRAAQLLTAAIYDVCLFPDEQPSKRRDMTAVVDWFSPAPPQIRENFLRLQNSGVRTLVRVGNQIESANEDTRADLFDTVLRHINIWGAPQLEQIVSGESYPLNNLRRERASLYLCVTPEELTDYRPIIRALLGQMLYTIRDAKDEWDRLPVTFFLDEFPQLGYFPEIEQMLALGRQAGLRLWIFAQARAQLEQVYGDADRLMDMMAVVSYIQPTFATAEEISRQLGKTKDIYSGDEKPLVTPQELMGPDYADKVIVFEATRQPAKLRRIMTFEDEYASGAVAKPNGDLCRTWARSLLKCTLPDETGNFSAERLNEIVEAICYQLCKSFLEDSLENYHKIPILYVNTALSAIIDTLVTYSNAGSESFMAVPFFLPETDVERLKDDPNLIAFDDYLYANKTAAGKIFFRRSRVVEGISCYPATLSIRFNLGIDV